MIRKFSMAATLALFALVSSLSVGSAEANGGWHGGGGWNGGGWHGGWHGGGWGWHPGWGYHYSRWPGYYGYNPYYVPYCYVTVYGTTACY